VKAMAGMATIPGRSHLLEQVLTRLRPQVDSLAVYLGQYKEVPECVHRLADKWVLDPDDQLGSEGKLAWTHAWDGLYMAVDDDILYPVDYRERVQREVELFEGRAVVTIQGAAFPRHMESFTDPKIKWMRWNKTYGTGMWLSMPAGCFTSFHTSLRFPVRWPERNADDHQIAVWAQQEKVPIWGLPHAADWCSYLLPKKDPKVYSIFREEKRNGFARRNRILSQVKSWKLHATSPIQ
jgi:hypothetical protein